MLDEKSALVTAARTTHESNETFADLVRQVDHYLVARADAYLERALQHLEREPAGQTFRDAIRFAVDHRFAETSDGTHQRTYLIAIPVVISTDEVWSNLVYGVIEGGGAPC